MKKIIFLLALIFSTTSLFSTKESFSGVKASENINYQEHFTYELKENGNYKINGLNSSFLDRTNYRIYATSDITNTVVDEISLDIFSSCPNIETLMISKDISTIPNNFFSNLNLEKVYFTGSLDEWSSYNFLDTVNVFDYACDEGFINYWNKYVRVDENSNICNITNEIYEKVSSLYESLDMADYERVNAYKDASGETIEDSMEYLDDLFNQEEKPKQEELPKDTTLALVIVIAIFGMSSIAIFYLLKKKEIID